MDQRTTKHYNQLCELQGPRLRDIFEMKAPMYVHGAQARGVLARDLRESRDFGQIFCGQGRQMDHRRSHRVIFVGSVTHQRMYRGRVSRDEGKVQIAPKSFGRNDA